jgi:hypothetical protein
MSEGKTHRITLSDRKRGAPRNELCGVLEGQAQDVDARALDAAPRMDHLLHGLAGDVASHAVVEAPFGGNQLGVVTDDLRLVGKGSNTRLA